MGGASYVAGSALWRCYAAPLAWGEGSVAQYGEAGNVCIRAIYLQTLW